MNWTNLLIELTYFSHGRDHAGRCLWVLCRPVSSWIAVLLVLFPEMAGLSLEGVQSIFTNGSGIRASARVEKLEKELQAGGHTKDDR